jgi:cytochrome oxidase Cu insertion factor (SCO1/SenC/PrrC family)/thiol-disulfide isomerase/thioredoxin
VRLRSKPVVVGGVLLAAGVGALFVPRGASPQPAFAGDVLPARPAPSFHLTDQFGRSVSLKQFRGHPVILTFLQATCTGLCPVTTETIRRSLEELGPRGKRVVVLAISADPKGDTRPAVLRFSRQHHMLHRWHYLTGTKAALKPVWHGYYVYVAPPNAPRALKNGHTSAVYLLDGQGRERVLMVGDPSTDGLARDLRILLGVAPDSSLAASVPAPQVGHPAPAFTIHTLSGSTIRLAAVHRPVLLNFWATWCTACKTEIPMMSAWYRAHSRQVMVVGVDQQEPKSPVASFVRRYHIPYLVGLDGSGSVSARYNVIDLPTSLLINRHGVVIAVHVGALNRRYLARLQRTLTSGGEA